MCFDWGRKLLHWKETKCVSMFNETRAADCGNSQHVWFLLLLHICLYTLSSLPTGLCMCSWHFQVLTGLQGQCWVVHEHPHRVSANALVDISRWQNIRHTKCNLASSVKLWLVDRLSGVLLVKIGSKLVISKWSTASTGAQIFLKDLVTLLCVPESTKRLHLH